jgi:pimeloyl-ACP methyl ester carboxylesterase
MERRIGALRCEVVDPESAKFTAPLLLLHGLWSTPHIWRPFTGYLAHRGWLSVAPHLQAHAEDMASVASHERAIGAVIAALPATPVIIGYDLGGLLALRLAHAAAAVVAIAPLVPYPLATPSSALHGAGTWLERLLNRPRRAPRGRWKVSYPAAHHPRYEPAALLDELGGARVDLSAHTPGIPALVLVGDQDPVTPPAAAGTVAKRVNAELRVETGANHALPVDPGWEQRVSAIHRWIVQSIGQQLLALFDESAFENR